jgi:ferrous iron transport protein A
MLLNDLPDGAQATVFAVVSSNPDVGTNALLRLAELGFIAGEPVELVRRGPGGREPLAVLVGNTLIALRRVEAECVQVTAAPQQLD